MQERRATKAGGATGTARLGAWLDSAAACAGTIVVPHLPCIALMLAASSSAMAAAIVNNLAIVSAMSAAAAGGGYMSWKKLRREKSGPLEKTFMKAAFVLAALAMIALHLPGTEHHHHHDEDSAPAHHQSAHTGAGGKIGL